MHRAENRIWDWSPSNKDMEDFYKYSSSLNTQLIYSSLLLDHIQLNVGDSHAFCFVLFFHKEEARFFNVR